MPLPTLNTGGVNITNSLLNIDRAKTDRLQREGMSQQNALRDIQLSPEYQKAQKETQNAILKGKQLENQELMYKHASEGLNATIANTEAGDEKAYDKYREHMVQMGVPEERLPDPSVFYDTKIDVRSGKEEPVSIFNKERFINWGNRNLVSAADMRKGAAAKYIQKILYGPENKTMLVNIKEGESYIPEKGWSFKEADKVTPSKVKTSYTNTAGEEIQVMDNGESMIVDQISGELRKALPNEIIKAEKEDKSKALKFKSVMQNQFGETVFLMDNGSVMKAGPGGKPIAATEEESKGLKKPEEELSPIEQMVMASLSKNEVANGNKKPKTPKAPKATKAPKVALDALKENPDKLNDFKKKYGYTPEGY